MLIAAISMALIGILVIFVVLAGSRNSTDDIKRSIQGQHEEIRNNLSKEQVILSESRHDSSIIISILKHFVFVAIVTFFCWLASFMWLENEVSKTEYIKPFDPNDPEAFYIRPDYSNMTPSELAKRTADFMRTEEYNNFTSEQKKILRGYAIPDFETAVNVLNRHNVTERTKFKGVPIWIIAASVLTFFYISIVIFKALARKTSNEVENGINADTQIKEGFAVGFIKNLMLAPMKKKLNAYVDYLSVAKGNELGEMLAFATISRMELMSRYSSCAYLLDKANRFSYTHANQYIIKAMADVYSYANEMEKYGKSNTGVQAYLSGFAVWKMTINCLMGHDGERLDMDGCILGRKIWRELKRGIPYVEAVLKDLESQGITIEKWVYDNYNYVPEMFDI